MSESSVERRKGEQQGNRTMKCIILVGVSLPLTGPHFTYNDYSKPGSLEKKCFFCLWGHFCRIILDLFLDFFVTLSK